MLHITNISVTKAGAAVFRREQARFKLRGGEVLELGYVSSFTNPDGTTVDGFRPGYMITAASRDRLTDRYAEARLSDGTEFYFLPKFKWSAREWYLVDRCSPLYGMLSIEPAHRGRP